jgi:hypothetical protein
VLGVRLRFSWWTLRFVQFSKNIAAHFNGAGDGNRTHDISLEG